MFKNLFDGVLSPCSPAPLTIRGHDPKVKGLGKQIFGEGGPSVHGKGVVKKNPTRGVRVRQLFFARKKGGVTKCFSNKGVGISLNKLNANIKDYFLLRYYFFFQNSQKLLLPTFFEKRVGLGWPKQEGVPGG